MRAGGEAGPLFQQVLERTAGLDSVSTKASTEVPPKLSHKPSGSVRQRVLPGSFRNGWYRRSSEGRPRSQASFPTARTPGGRWGHCFRRSLTSESKVWDGRILFPGLFYL